MGFTAALFMGFPLNSPNTVPMSRETILDSSIGNFTPEQTDITSKKFEDETNLRCYLLSDHSRSMGYGSGSYSKAEYAQTLSATLAYFLFKQGDAVGLLSFDDDFRELHSGS